MTLVLALILNFTSRSAVPVTRPPAEFERHPLNLLASPLPLTQPREKPCGHRSSRLSLNLLGYQGVAPKERKTGGTRSLQPLNAEES